MFIEPTITWVSSGFSEYIGLDTKIVLKKTQKDASSLDKGGDVRRKTELVKRAVRD